MKKPFNSALPIDYTPKKRVTEETKIDLKPCIVCQKQITDGDYGSWGDGGVCSKTCNTIQSKKPKYPDHTEEDFLRRQCENMDKDH